MRNACWNIDYSDGHHRAKFNIVMLVRLVHVIVYAGVICSCIISHGYASEKKKTLQHVMLGNTPKGYPFVTCGNSGPVGPTQYQCSSYYQPQDRNVQVIKNGPMAGIQVWIIPKNNTYSITALGASGGLGVQNPKASKGGYTNAKFNLTEGDEIYMLVGQVGQSACAQTNSITEDICRDGMRPTLMDPERRHLAGGGGGGGGGTFVFKKDKITGEFIPLIIAGGGGGRSYLLGDNAIRSAGGYASTGTGSNAFTPPLGPGGGGGWDGLQSDLFQSGGSLLQGAIGGQPCPDAKEHWNTRGGFGGGGGGCSAGGGGGGYTGGNVSMTDDPSHNGQGGASYIHPSGMEPHMEPETQEGKGEVEIAMVLACDCEFMCIYQNYEEKQFKCYCAPNSILADDGISCIDKDTLKPLMEKPDSLPSSAIIAIILSLVGLILVAIVFAFCAVRQCRRRQPMTVGLDALTHTDYQLDRLRGQGMVTEYNPNYDFGGTKYTLQDLMEIPRKHLNLIRALGQGAFGEVYQGTLDKGTNGTPVPVAVKTLPALSADQAEMDFLMEALIMSKFCHPNIVSFLGVCFDKHPRFIILELLEGGDLKSFLRESRPKPDMPSSLTMTDLVNLSLDVAKGCQYLEENHFIHRDIAARNCLLSTKGPSRVAKIADFGMARDIYRADYYRKGGRAMLPVKWMPPEAFLDGVFTSKTDVWSFGILLWEVFSLGYMPYPGRGNQEVMQIVTAGGRLDIPQNCPHPVFHIMMLCWHGIAEKRPCFAEILERLKQCQLDPEVIHSPLPVFHRPPSIERDPTLMRPRDPDCMVLTVEPSKQYLEPDSPKSTDQLIGPITPDLVKIAAEVPEAAQADPKRKDKASTSKLHNLETWPGEKPETFPPKPVFDYDVATNAEEEPAQGEAYVDHGGEYTDNDDFLVDSSAHLLGGAIATALSDCAPAKDALAACGAAASSDSLPNKTSPLNHTSTGLAKTDGPPDSGEKHGGYTDLPDADNGDPWRPRLPAEQPRLTRNDRRAPQPKILYENIRLPSESASPSRDNEASAPAAQNGIHSAQNPSMQGQDSGVMLDLKRGTTIGRYDIKDSQWL